MKAESGPMYSQLIPEFCITSNHFVESNYFLPGKSDGKAAPGTTELKTDGKEGWDSSCPTLTIF